MTNFMALIFGVSGSGKSFFLRQNLIDKFSRVVYFDTQNEIEPGETVGKRFMQGMQFAESFSEFEFLYRLNFNQDSFRIICKFEESEEMKAIDSIWKNGEVTCIFEEIDLISSSTSGKDSLYKIATKGRHRNINLIGTTQRPSRISIDLRSQAHVLISFRQNERADIDYFKKISLERSERLPELQLGEYEVFRGDEILTEQIITR